MATAIVQQPEPVPAAVTLELTEEEALYVLGVLGNESQPVTFGVESVESVYSALFDALRAAGFSARELYATSEEVRS